MIEQFRKAGIGRNELSVAGRNERMVRHAGGLMVAALGVGRVVAAGPVHRDREYDRRSRRRGGRVSEVAGPSDASRSGDGMGMIERMRSSGTAATVTRWGMWAAGSAGEGRLYGIWPP